MESLDWHRFYEQQARAIDDSDRQIAAAFAFISRDRSVLDSSRRELETSRKLLKRIDAILAFHS